MRFRSGHLALGLAACWLGAVACASSRSLSVPQPFPDVATYDSARQLLISQERARRLGSSLALNAEEQDANRKLSALRSTELERVGASFPPAHSYLLDSTKKLIDSSPVLEVMRRLPKGGILHVHGSAGGDLRWLVSQGAMRKDAYLFRGEGNPVRGSLRFFAAPPGAGWHSVAELRGAAPDPLAFDEEIYRSMTLGEEDLAAPDIWREFINCFRRGAGLYDDEPLREAHWRRMLAGMADDNVQYVEFRGWPVDEALLQEARQRDPAFAVKFIPALGRSFDRERAKSMLERVLAERERDPGRVVGFDLVDEEDRTNTTRYFAEEILAAQREAARRGFSLPLFLHSGESIRAANENLYDAVALGARRIGHGLALARHPLLMEMVRERGIAVEVCPISNQILGYVPDLRAHPAVALIAAGIPIVLAPDDPGIMRHTFSYDYYAAFMAWELDLRDLKQLALNSLLYSAMSPEEKANARSVWEKRWADFVRWLNTAELARASTASARDCARGIPTRCPA